jgi:UDP-N-acetylmuramoyl-tripeptide--D-alanyl-D-alanine ligase
VNGWSSARVAEAAGAELVRAGGPGGPSRVVVDSRGVGPGDLFVALRGERVDGGRFAAAALAAGAWGVLVSPEWTEALDGEGAALVAPEPLLALHALARAWRWALGAQVIGVTGSVGKTSTKDLIAAMIAPHRAVAASRENFNTEIGLPLELLAAPAGTEVLVLELAMRGAGQIAELTAICEPDVGVVTNVGPVHLELLGSIENIGRAKGELLEGLRAGATAVVPYDEPLLAHALRDELDVVTFGTSAEADVRWEEPGRALRARGERIELELPWRSGPQLSNALAAVAAAQAVGVRPEGRVEIATHALRGARVDVGGGVTVINDCYNASPPSMTAALDELATEAPSGRRVAVLGDMLELGPTELDLHRAVGAHAAASGVELLITVGPRAAAMLDAFDGEAHAVADAGEAAALAGDLLQEGDLVLVKASNGMKLWTVTEALVSARG